VQRKIGGPTIQNINVIKPLLKQTREVLWCNSTRLKVKPPCWRYKQEVRW